MPPGFAGEMLSQLDQIVDSVFMQVRDTCLNLLGEYDRVNPEHIWTRCIRSCTVKNGSVAGTDAFLFVTEHRTKTPTTPVTAVACMIDYHDRRGEDLLTDCYRETRYRHQGSQD